MSTSFSAIPITKHVYWVGAIDWNIRDFHGYATGRGTTYNAYLIMDRKVTLIDTVKRPFFHEMVERIRSVVDPSKIDIIVSNHAEMDHSGSLPEAIELIKPDQVFASSMGQGALQEHFHWKTKVLAVKDQEKLVTGELELQFIETRMLHWPDSMFTWIEKEKLLFSQDAFGMHLASGQRFADELAEPVLIEESAKYFANILLPYAPLIPKLIQRCQQLKINPEIIAPDHGPVFRRDLGPVIERYLRWGAQRQTDKIVIVYDTMWESTHQLARTLEERFRELGHPVSLLCLHAAHRSDVITELLDAGALCVGSPTLNNQMFPTLADLLTYAAGLKPQHLLGLAFGSYGWSGEGVKKVADALTAMGVEVLSSVKCKYRPDAETLVRCRQAATELSEAVRARLEQA